MPEPLTNDAVQGTLVTAGQPGSEYTIENIPLADPLLKVPWMVMAFIPDVRGFPPVNVKLVATPVPEMVNVLFCTAKVFNLTVPLWKETLTSPLVMILTVAS